MRPPGILRWLPAGVLALAAVLAAGCGPRNRAPAGGRASPAVQPIGEVLKLTVVPYEAADRLAEEYTPMARYLASRLGRRSGEFRSVVDYAGVLAALETGQVDVAYLSPFPYALASSRMKLHPLAMPHVFDKLTYRGIVFVRADSPIRSLQDLRGRVVAFGDEASTTGYLLPRALLERSGIPLSALKRWYNAGDANVVVKAVENGSADAGCAYEAVFQVAYRDSPEKAKAMRVVAHTDEIPNGIYVGRGTLPPDEVARLRKAFLDMNTDPEGRAAMLKAPNQKMVEADDRLFDGVRETARILDLDLTVFEKKGR